MALYGNVVMLDNSYGSYLGVTFNQNLTMRNNSSLSSVVVNGNADIYDSAIVGNSYFFNFALQFAVQGTLTFHSQSANALNFFAGAIAFNVPSSGGSGGFISRLLRFPWFIKF